MDPLNTKAWIFVSHASADIQNVRQVRNYLEQKGAAPLLFHLRALEQSEEFWPLIEREIAARNFFLYCESEAAENSPWVTRERAAVANAARIAPKRIGHVRVDGENINEPTLDAFLRKTRAFLVYERSDIERVERYATAVREAGVTTFEHVVESGTGGEWGPDATDALRKGAADGWVVVFLSPTQVQVPVAILEFARTTEIYLVVVSFRGFEASYEYSFFHTAGFSHEGPTVLATYLLRR